MQTIKYIQKTLGALGRGMRRHSRVLIAGRLYGAASFRMLRRRGYIRTVTQPGTAHNGLRCIALFSSQVIPVEQINRSELQNMKMLSSRLAMAAPRLTNSLR